MATQWTAWDAPVSDDLPLEEGLTPLAASIFWLAARHDQPRRFVDELLAGLATSWTADYAALVVAERGRWQARGHFGRPRPWPVSFLADVSDRGTAGHVQLPEGTWLATPLDPRHPEELLLFSVTVSLDLAERSRQLAALAPIVLRGLNLVRERNSERRRIRRLEALLEITSQWNQTREMEPLLKSMAETATRLLQADRASIFLWDRSTRTLVGRPALGVEEGELRIPDDSGIVGYVLRTGESRRVDADGPDEINRQVDHKLNYQTRTLLCVPLNGADGQRFGAFEVLNKNEGNFTADDEEALHELAAHAAVALENAQERLELLATRRQFTEQAAQSVRLIGQSPAIEALRAKVNDLAVTDLAVLILGENGTGKEVVSQMIHYWSKRRDKPFIAVNCAAITETLLESELFGHEKGAFTDAHESRAGKFESASGGTLFLDEIGDMSPGGQAKMLRVLEERVVVRVGGSKPIHTDVRVIAATNQDLAGMVRQKKFREDLYYRLNVVTLFLPPLRERGEDALLLAEHFLQDFCQKARRKRAPKFSAEARRRMLTHGWPGNVRELRNLMERLAYLHAADRIEAEDLTLILPPTSDADPLGSLIDQPLAAATDNFQMEYIRKAIGRVRGNMSEAAKLLGLHRSNLYRKMRQLHMEVHEPPRPEG